MEGLICNGSERQILIPPLSFLALRNFFKSMNNENNDQVKSPALEENKKFKEAIASKNDMLKEKDEIILSLQNDLGERELTISALTKEKDIEKSLRIKAERIITNDKKLAQTGQEMYAPPKSKEEKFAEAYKKAREELRK
ncbi:15801_t:CDS:1 [Funneliformis geosporum]|nr:15801_t:CDS:1 [Funneliformis geosporum]